MKRWTCSVGSCGSDVPSCRSRASSTWIPRVARCSAGSTWLRWSSTRQPGRTRFPSSRRAPQPRRETGSPSSPGSRMSSEPRHLHPAAMLIDAIRIVRRSLSAFVIPGVVFLASRGFDVQTIVLVLFGALVVAVFAAFWGFLSWRATTYEVAGGVFRLRWGVVQKNERTIPLDHVQSVDTVQGIIQRLFGVVEVRIETAGGGASEPDASLAALDRAAAEALRREIEGSQRERVEESEGPTVLRRLSTGDLLIAGATSGQIGVAFSLLAVGSQFFDDFLSDEFVRR